MDERQGEDGRLWNSPLRKKLAKRGQDHIALVNKVTPKHLLKTPSQRKSERGKQKELKRAGVQSVSEPVFFDCHTCPQRPCGKIAQYCTERTIVLRCKGCGCKVRVYQDFEKPWMLCPVCQAKQGREQP
jgi:hypothetical protein